MKMIALLRDRSTWRSASVGKLGVNMNYRQFLGVICAKNLRESEILSPPLGPYKGIHENSRLFILNIFLDGPFMN